MTERRSTAPESVQADASDEKASSTPSPAPATQGMPSPAKILGLLTLTALTLFVSGGRSQAWLKRMTQGETTQRAQTSGKCARVMIGMFSTEKETGRQEAWRNMLGERLLNDPMAPYADQRLRCGLNFAFILGSPNDDPSNAEPIPNVIRVPIHENIDDGKSLMWWRYAAEHFSSATLVAKMDSDTQLCVQKFESFLIDLVCNGECADQLYVGNLVDWKGCGEWKHCPTGYIYGSGGLHLLSQDLVQYVAERSRSMNAKSMTGFEDMLTGRLLHESELLFKFVNTRWLRPSVYEFNQGNNAVEQSRKACPDG